MASRSRSSRRRWSETFKKRVVAEASEPGVTVTEIARRYDLDARRVSNWIKKFGSGVALVPVEVTSDHSGLPTSTAIEVDLPCGTRVRCGPETCTELVTSVIAALRSKRCLISGFCSSGRDFVPRFLQTSPRDDALALR